MACEYFEEQLSDWIDGELARHEQADLARHLETCEACRKALSEMLQDSLLLREIAVPPTPAGLTDKAMRLVRSRARWSAAGLGRIGQLSGQTVEKREHGGSDELNTVLKRAQQTRTRTCKVWIGRTFKIWIGRVFVWTRREATRRIGHVGRRRHQPRNGEFQ